MKRFAITVNGKTYDVQVEEKGATASAPVAVAPVAAAPAPVAPAPVAEPAAPAAPAATPVVSGSETVNAPMPGTIVNVMVSAGQAINEGDVLLILEAMKMENEIMAPRAGTVAGVHVNKGDSVNSGDALISLQ